MIQKKGAAYGVKTIVTEGKRQRLAADAGVARAEVRWSAVQDDRSRSDSRSGQRLLRSCGDVAFASGNVNPENLFQPALPSDPSQQARHGVHAAEPAIEHPQVFERALDFAWRPGVGIQQFGHHDALHAQTRASSSSSNCLL